MRKCLLFIVLLTMTNLHSESWNKIHKFSNLSLADMGNKLDYEFNDLATYVSKLNRNVIGISSSMADIATSIYARDVITENNGNGFVSTNQQETDDEIGRKKLSVLGTSALVGNKMTGDLFMDNCKIGVNLQNPSYPFHSAAGADIRFDGYYNTFFHWDNNVISSSYSYYSLIGFYPTIAGPTWTDYSGDPVAQGTLSLTSDTDGFISSSVWSTRAWGTSPAWNGGHTVASNAITFPTDCPQAQIYVWTRTSTFEDRLQYIPGYSYFLGSYPATLYVFDITTDKTVAQFDITALSGDWEGTVSPWFGVNSEHQYKIGLSMYCYHINKGHQLDISNIWIATGVVTGQESTISKDTNLNIYANKIDMQTRQSINLYGDVNIDSNVFIYRNTHIVGDTLIESTLIVNGTFRAEGDTYMNGTIYISTMIVPTGNIVLTGKIGISTTTSFVPQFSLDINTGTLHVANNTTSSMTYAGGILDLYPAFDATAQRIWTGGDLLIYGQNNTSVSNLRMDNANITWTATPAILSYGFDMLPNSNNSWSIGQVGLMPKNIYTYGLYLSSGIVVYAGTATSGDVNNISLTLDNWQSSRISMRWHNILNGNGGMGILSQANADHGYSSRVIINRTGAVNTAIDEIFAVYGEANQVRIGALGTGTSFFVDGWAYFSSATFSGTANIMASSATFSLNSNSLGGHTSDWFMNLSEFQTVVATKTFSSRVNVSSVAASGEISLSTGSHLSLNGIGGNNYIVTDAATGETRFYQGGNTVIRIH